MLKTRYHTNLIALVASAVSVPFCYASEIDDFIPPLSTVSIDLSIDEQKQKNQDLLLDYGFKNGSRSQLSVGRSLLEQDGESFNAHRYALGFSTSQVQDFSISLNYQYSGNRDDFNVDTLGGSLSWNHNDYSLIFSPSLRAISIYTSPVLLQNIVPEKIDLRSNAYTIAYYYFGSAHLFFNIAYTQFDYNRDVSKFNDPRAYLLISSQVGYLTSSFDQSQLNFTLGYSEAWGSFSGTYMKNRSAIDDSISHLFQLELEKSLGLSWSLRAKLGVSRVEHVDQSQRSFGLGLSYFW